MIQNGNRYLVTTDHWFVAPDGEQYRSAWGECYLKNIQEVFGFNPANPSTNWYLSIGKEGKEIIIAGCQIHYAIRSEEKPFNVFEGRSYSEKDSGLLVTANRIYYAE